MPFALVNGPSTFQCMTNALKRHLEFVRVNLEAVVILSQTILERKEHLRLVIELISYSRLKLKISKCEFAKRSVSLLGRISSKSGVRVVSGKVQAIKKTPRPTNQTEPRSFLGIARYYRRFNQSFADMSAPLHAMNSKKKGFVWTEELKTAFGNFKNALTSPPVVAFPDF